MKSALKVLAIVVVLACAAGPRAADAQAAYPAKPITIVVPFAAGGSTDLAARILAKALEQKWNVGVKIINKPGGNAVPGIADVLDSAPDGYTIMMDGFSSGPTIPVVVRDSSYERLMNRTYITLNVQTGMYVTVPASSPLKSLKDVIERIKSDPTTVTWTSIGGASVMDVASRQLIAAAGVPLEKTRPVVSKGGSEAAVHVAGGHVMVGAASYVATQPFVSAGKTRLLAIASPTRSHFTPEVPTAQELGYPGLNAIQWNGFSGPPKLPEEVVQKWHSTMQTMLADPTVTAELAKIGGEPLLGDGKAMASLIDSQVKMLKDLFPK